MKKRRGWRQCGRLPLDCSAQRGPRSVDQGIMPIARHRRHLVVGLVLAAVALATQGYAIGNGLPHWQTMVFTVLCLTQLGHVMAIRSERESLFTQGIFTNKPLISAVLGTIILQFATVYIPVLNKIFKTQPMTPTEFAVTLLLSSIVFIAVEIEKMIKRKKIQA